MPKSFQQKLKILYLMRVFSEKTDEAHPMSVKDLISYLESLGTVSYTHLTLPTNSLV